MRIGYLVRADRRGLAYQTGELYRALSPDVTVAVDMSGLAHHARWVQDFDQYPDAIVSPWTTRDLEEGGPHLTDEAREALLSCDVLYSAETFYDRQLVQWANEKQIATVRHINCELYGPEGESHPIYPTSWRLPDMPDGPTVPVPIPDDKIRGPAGEGLVLHVGGWKAMGDRNGTDLIRNTVRRTPDVKWRVTAQWGRSISRTSNVEQVGEVADRWELYDGCSMLVLPRKYGGLCLPAQEAAARGLALVMTDMAPNNEWPIVPLPISREFRVRRGTRILSFTTPPDIAKAVQGLLQEGLAEAQQQAVEWATGLKWSLWQEPYRMLLERAAEEMR